MGICTYGGQHGSMVNKIAENTVMTKCSGFGAAKFA
jgi:hypothetical protein